MKNTCPECGSNNPSRGCFIEQFHCETCGADLVNSHRMWLMIYIGVPFFYAALSISGGYHVGFIEVGLFGLLIFLAIRMYCKLGAAENIKIGRKAIISFVINLTLIVFGGLLVLEGSLFGGAIILAISMLLTRLIL